MIELNIIAIKIGTLYSIISDSENGLLVEIRLNINN